jgi:hypothetical protein
MDAAEVSAQLGTHPPNTYKLLRAMTTGGG